MTFRSLVLCYHAVSEDWDHELAVTPGALERQLRNLLRRGYRPVGLDAALDGRRRVFHVTFDDAFRSIAAAFPVLASLGIPATVFACAGYATDGRPLDVPELAEQAALFPEHLATMTWDELRAHAHDGVSVQSHTVTHPHLDRLSDTELAQELESSRAQVADEIGAPCPYLAYPYGESDPRVWAAAEKAGYDAAFVLRGSVVSGNPYAVPRIDIYRRDSLARAILKTSFSGRPLQRFSGVLHRSG